MTVSLSVARQFSVERDADVTTAVGVDRRRDGTRLGLLHNRTRVAQVHGLSLALIYMAGNSYVQ